MCKKREKPYPSASTELKDPHQTRKTLLFNILDDLLDPLHVALDAERPPDRPQPFQVSVLPCIDKTEKQDADKQEDLDKHKKTLSGKEVISEVHDDGIDKDQLHVEDNEEDGDKIEAGVEVYPARADGVLTAFIGCQFLGIRPVRCNNLYQDHGEKNDKESGDEKDENISVRIEHSLHFSRYRCPSDFKKKLRHDTTENVPENTIAWLVPYMS